MKSLLRASFALVAVAAAASLVLLAAPTAASAKDSPERRFDHRCDACGANIYSYRKSSGKDKHGHTTYQWKVAGHNCPRAGHAEEQEQEQEQEHRHAEHRDGCREDYRQGESAPYREYDDRQAEAYQPRYDERRVESAPYREYDDRQAEAYQPRYDERRVESAPYRDFRNDEFQPRYEDGRAPYNDQGYNDRRNSCPEAAPRPRCEQPPVQDSCHGQNLSSRDLIINAIGTLIQRRLQDHCH
ncbi:MAG: hypothetical protein AB7I98_06445 [Verrucomicrobiales bacterium]